MRIVSLEPFITDVVRSIGLEADLVGVSSHCEAVPPLTKLPTINKQPIGNGLEGITIEQLTNLAPDIVLLSLPEGVVASQDASANTKLEQHLRALSEQLSAACGKAVKVKSYAPVTLDQVFQCYEDLGKDLGQQVKGREMAQRAKAQFMDWSDSFYDRMKNKRVAVFVGVEPLTLGGLWIPDMIHLASCQSAEPVGGSAHRPVRWADILAFRPDVLIVAPSGMNIEQAKRTFMLMEKIPDWELAPAVKRGEVFFMEGDKNFLRPGPALMKGMGILISAISGIDSGYITDRDSFFRLRSLELQRHKLR